MMCSGPTRPFPHFGSVRPRHLDARPPQVDDRYKNLKPVGRGAYGLVASAEDTLTGRKARNLMCCGLRAAALSVLA